MTGFWQAIGSKMKNLHKDDKTENQFFVFPNFVFHSSYKCFNLRQLKSPLFLVAITTILKLS